MAARPDTLTVSAQTLAGIDLFRDLSGDARAALAGQLHARRYRRGQQIVSHRDRGREVFFVVSGRVRATVYSASGKEVSFEDLEAGGMFGELAAIDGGTRSTHVIALTDSLLAVMGEAAFLRALETHPQLAMAVLRRLAGLVRAHCGRIFEFSTLGVRNRIHAELLRLGRRQGGGANTVVILSAPTHAEIAARVSTHREAVTRELKRLEAAGLIDWRPGRHVIRDLRALQRLVEQVRDG